MSSFFPHRHLLAADAFKASIENAIVRAEDLYELDGETFLRRCGGCIETFDAKLATGGRQ